MLEPQSGPDSWVESRTEAEVSLCAKSATKGCDDDVPPKDGKTRHHHRSDRGQAGSLSKKDSVLTLAPQ